MAREVDLSAYLPPVMKGLYEFQQIAAAEKPEFIRLFSAADTCLLDCFIPYASPPALRRYERMLGIPSDSRLSLEERRAAVLTKWNQQLPYTMRRLIEQLTLWAGADGFFVDAGRLSEYVIEVGLIDKFLPLLRSVKDAVEQMIPANLALLFSGVYQNSFSVPARYENVICFQSGFFPRYNLPFLYLDRSWKLDSGRRLSGYDSGDVLDFYPVHLWLSSGVREAVRSGERLRLTGGVRVRMQGKGAFRAAAAAKETVWPRGRLRLRNGMATDVSAGSAFYVIQGAKERLLDDCAMRLQAEAGEITGKEERVLVRAGAEASIATEGHMTKWNQVDATWRFDGGRRLDGGRYSL